MLLLPCHPFRFQHGAQALASRRLCLPVLLILRYSAPAGLLDHGAAAGRRAVGLGAGAGKCASWAVSSRSLGSLTILGSCQRPFALHWPLCRAITARWTPAPYFARSSLPSNISTPKASSTGERHSRFGPVEGRAARSCGALCGTGVRHCSARSRPADQQLLRFSYLRAAT